MFVKCINVDLQCIVNNTILMCIYEYSYTCEILENLLQTISVFLKLILRTVQFEKNCNFEIIINQQSHG